MTLDTLTFSQQLINRASVTPSDGGCLALIEQALRPYGFKAEYVNQGVVKNLYLTQGVKGPLMVFLGHVDVVPPGPPEAWAHDPFTATVNEGYLYGRGSADMKTAIAAFVVAVQRVINSSNLLPFRLGLLLTSDEEGPGLDGIRHVMKVLQHRGEHIDYCLVGEPSSTKHLGDTLKIGRRGSLSFNLIIHGIQGHIAYPQFAHNPIHCFAPILQRLITTTWDQGYVDFEATTFQCSHIHAGVGATNIIPGELTLNANFRYAPSVTAEYLRHQVEHILNDAHLKYSIEWHHSGEPFISAPGPLRAAAIHAIETITGLIPNCSTDGGTSDGRFVAPTGTEVIELGVCNKTIHQIDECVKISDLDTLTAIYTELLTRLNA